MQKIIEVIYEDGVFKPLKKVDLKEGERVKIKIEDRTTTLRKYRGVFGKAKAEELMELEGEVIL